MTDIDSDIKQHSLANSVQNQENPSKFYNHFLYKAVIVLIFLVILPLFPSQAPEFIHQTIVTRNWELLHLIFVGIAVSYGLFSHRNDETEKENNDSKFDNAQSYVSRVLQVSSIFEDEAESPATESNENKVQTWNHRYQRNEPVVVMDQHHDERRATSSKIEEKPLLLPIRSLKSRVSDHGVTQTTSESSPSSGSINRSNSKSSSKRFSVNPNKDADGLLGAKDSKENMVLPSPIPWRSRSGRMNMKDDVEISSPNSMPFSLEESKLGKPEPKSSSKSQTSSSFQTKSSSPSPLQFSPRKLSPLPSFASEAQAKTAEDLNRKKSFHKSPSAPILPPSPPPPPPPPPPMMQKASSMKPNSGNEEAAYEKELRRSLTSEKKDSKWSNGDNILSGADAVIEAKARNHVEGPFMGKSVRTIRKLQTLPDTAENNANVKRGSDFQRSYMENPARMAITYEQTSFSAPSRKDQFCIEEIQEEENGDYVDKVVVESDVDTESEDGYDDDDIAGNFMHNDVETSPPKNDEISDNVEADSSNDGPDVDKKADEFIAKFREQIRLQRIDSIKRSSAQIKRNSSR